MTDLWERALGRRELEQRERAIETLLNQEAVQRLEQARGVVEPPRRKRSQAAIDWLRRELVRVREHLSQQQQGERS